MCQEGPQLKTRASAPVPTPAGYLIRCAFCLSQEHAGCRQGRSLCLVAGVFEGFWGWCEEQKRLGSDQSVFFAPFHCVQLLGRVQRGRAQRHGGA